VRFEKNLFEYENEAVFRQLPFKQHGGAKKMKPPKKMI
jgi:hypothetical protein